MSYKKLFIILFITLPLLAAPEPTAANARQGSQADSTDRKCGESMLACAAGVIFTLGAYYAWSEYGKPYLQENYPEFLKMFESDAPQMGGSRKKPNSEPPNQTRPKVSQSNLDKCMRWYGLENRDIEVTWTGDVRIIDEAKIRKQYHKLALKYHPDKFKGKKEDGERKFQKIVHCYEEVFRTGKE